MYKFDGSITYTAGYGENAIDIINQTVKEQILVSFNAVNQYGTFEGTTLNFLEGCWSGYRNNTTGIGLYMTRNYFAVFYIKDDAVTQMKHILKFLNT